MIAEELNRDGADGRRFFMKEDRCKKTSAEDWRMPFAKEAVGVFHLCSSAQSVVKSQILNHKS
jgi:hypothetical protein